MVVEVKGLAQCLTSAVRVVSMGTASICRLTTFVSAALATEAGIVKQASFVYLFYQWANNYIGQRDHILYTNITVSCETHIIQEQRESFEIIK